MINLNEQIKCILTNLLNSEGVKGDRRSRMWIQIRLMSVEKELRGSRSRVCEERGSEDTSRAMLSGFAS